MKFLKKYNKRRLVWVFILLVILLLICYAAAFSKDDGVILNSFQNILAKGYEIFLFPILFLFGNYIDQIFFIIGLLLNCLFYAFLIETVVILIKAFMNRVSPSINNTS
jgi:hypothetical protein